MALKLNKSQGRYSLLVDRRGNIFKQDNQNPDADPVATGRRRLPIEGTLNMGIKAFKRQHKKFGSKAAKRYKEHAWAQIEEGLENHIKAQDKKRVEKRGKEAS